MYSATAEINSEPEVVLARIRSHSSNDNEERQYQQTQRRNYRLKLRKVVGTKSAEGILEVKHTSHGDGSTVGNVKDGFNVRKVCKIIKNLRRVSTLHRTIDV